MGNPDGSSSSESNPLPNKALRGGEQRLCVSFCHAKDIREHLDVFVDGQASVRSDFSGVIRADDEVALVLGEVCWKLQVGNQVHHIVVAC